jgi:hypothetical protein
VQSLNLNRSASGTLGTPYANDQWTFAAAAGQQVRLRIINTSAPGITFTLKGPNGYEGFTEISGDSALLTLPTSGAYSVQVHGLNGVTGSYTFSLQQTSVTDLALGATYDGTWAGSGEAR